MRRKRTRGGSLRSLTLATCTPPGCLRDTTLAPGLTALDPRLPDHLAAASPIAVAWRRLDRTLEAMGRRKNRPGQRIFRKLSRQQKPKYLWIGCADSRVPANEMVGLLPGELFVHRNVANVVSLNDPNCLSVIQYAVDILQVWHIIVCGHYGCGGVQAVLDDVSLGLCDQWLKHVRDVYQKHREELSQLKRVLLANRLCELNVIEQVNHVAETGILRNAWERQQRVSVHGWVYSIDDGFLRDLWISIERPGSL